MTRGDYSMIAGCTECSSDRICGACSRRDLCTAAMAARLEGVPRPIAHKPADRRSASRRRQRDALYQTLKGFAGALRALRKERKPSFPHKVEQHIASLLGSGPVRIESVARNLGYSRQTLYRRLKADGVTFEQLFDELRHRQSLRLVRDRGLTIKEIAYQLGFSDPASFSRAFKRWTGTSPQSLRADMRRRS